MPRELSLFGQRSSTDAIRTIYQTAVPTPLRLIRTTAATPRAGCRPTVETMNRWVRCSRCDRMRAQVLVARVMTGAASLWHCPECGAAIVPVTFDRSNGGLQQNDRNITSSPCPCAAGGPVHRATMVLEPKSALWLCETCGLGRTRTPGTTDGAGREHGNPQCPRCGSRQVRSTLITYWGAYCRCMECGSGWRDVSHQLEDREVS